jgi:PAS domain S-box-containing protein
MLNDLTEADAKTHEDPGQELEGHEGVEDFESSPFWQRLYDPSENARETGAAGAPSPLTLAQALDLLEVETGKRRQAEESVREKEERFRQMSRYLGKFLWLSDAATHKLIYVSPGYEQIWHTKREGCYAKPEDWTEQTPPDDAEQNTGTPRQGEGNKPDGGDYQAVGPDGSLRWIRERMYPIQDEAGRVLYFLGIAEDITDLKCLETALRKNETVRRALLRLIPDTMLKLSSDGTILEFKAAKQEPELKPTLKLRGRNIKNLLSEAMTRQVMQTMQRALSTGRVQSLSLRLSIAGALRRFEVRCVPGGDGEILALAREVTDSPPAG